MLSMIMGLFSGRGLKLLLGAGIAAGIAGGAWLYMERGEDLAELRIENSGLKKEVQLKEEVNDRLAEQYNRAIAHNEQIQDDLQRSRAEVSELTETLKNVDFGAMAENSPDKLERLFTEHFRQELECIEAASGKEAAECPSDTAKGDE